MLFQAFVGGSYLSQSWTADSEDCINWYPENIQSPGAPFKSILLPTPGVETVSADLPPTPTTSIRHPFQGRAHIFASGREFAVIGDTLVEFDAAGARTYPGGVGNLIYDGNPATISHNGDRGHELFITSGTVGYIFDLNTNVLTNISALSGKATMGGYIEGYFLALDAETSTLYISKLFDGLTWTTGTDFAQRSLQPDRWKSMIVCGRLIWLFGETTSEPWYNTGDTFPFAPYPSGSVGFGVAAPWSPKLIGSDVLWLARTSGGRKCVVKTSGVTPQVISSYPVEAQFQSYDFVTDIVGDAYSERGHSFYLLHADRQGVTWAWDSETQLWTKRGTWLRDEGKYVSWRPRFYAYAFDQHRMLDPGSASLYRLSSDLGTDVDGLGVRRLRRAPALNSENHRVFFPEFQLDLDRGEGIAVSENPQAMLRLSNDGGKTWIAEMWRSVGKRGDWSHRVQWQRLGCSRRRVFELVVSDPIPWRITGAYLPGLEAAS